MLQTEDFVRERPSRLRTEVPGLVENLWNTRRWEVCTPHRAFTGGTIVCERCSGAAVSNLVTPNATPSAKYFVKTSLNGRWRFAYFCASKLSKRRE